MGGTLKIPVNNNGTIFLTQIDKDGTCNLWKYDGEKTQSDRVIPGGDIVMLLNLYRYIKDNDIKNDFINPSGKNKE